MKNLLLFLFVFLSSCASRNYTHYLVDPPPKRPQALQDDDNLARPLTYGTTTSMKVRWNDGNIMTEVDLPMLSSGQRIVIEHSSGSPDVKTVPGSRLVAPPPTAADETLAEAYRSKGLRENVDAASVSITRARTLMQDALKNGNYHLAFEWCELVLQRYPSHPEFLRAKASLLLMMGEREKAIEIYEKAETIETNPSVRKKLEELQKQGAPGAGAAPAAPKTP